MVNHCNRKKGPAQKINDKYGSKFASLAKRIVVENVIVYQTKANFYARNHDTNHLDIEQTLFKICLKSFLNSIIRLTQVRDLT